MWYLYSALAGREACCNFLTPYERVNSTHLLMLTEVPFSSKGSYIKHYIKHICALWRPKFTDVTANGGFIRLSVFGTVTYTFNSICNELLTTDAVRKWRHRNPSRTFKCNFITILEIIVWRPTIQMPWGSSVEDRMHHHGHRKHIKITQMFSICYVTCSRLDSLSDHSARVLEVSYAKAFLPSLAEHTVESWWCHGHTWLGVQERNWSCCPGGRDGILSSINQTRIS